MFKSVADFHVLALAIARERIEDSLCDWIRHFSERGESWFIGPGKMVLIIDEFPMSVRHCRTRPTHAREAHVAAIVSAQ